MSQIGRAGMQRCTYRLASADEKRGRRAEVPCEKDTGEPS